MTNDDFLERIYLTLRSMDVELSRLSGDLIAIKRALSLDCDERCMTEDEILKMPINPYDDEGEG